MDFPSDEQHPITKYIRYIRITQENPRILRDPNGCLAILAEQKEGEEHGGDNV